MVEDKANIEIKSDSFNTHIKIISVLGILIFSLIFLSLISFSPSDEQNAQVAFGDLLKLFSGDDELEAKASITKNWLGLSGAKISDFIYNGTIGYYAFSVPLVAIYWLVIIFLRKKIDKSLIKYTIIFFLMGIFFSSFIGSLQHIDFLVSIPKEWSGGVGQFLSNLFVKIVGVFGSIVVFAAGIVLIIYLSSEIRIVLDSKFNFSKIYAQFLSKIKFKKVEKIKIDKEENVETNIPNVTLNNPDKLNIDNDLIDLDINNQNEIREIIPSKIDPIVGIMKSPKLNIKKINPEDSIVSSNFNPFEENAKTVNELKTQVVDNKDANDALVQAKTQLKSEVPRINIEVNKVETSSDSMLGDSNIKTSEDESNIPKELINLNPEVNLENETVDEFVENDFKFKIEKSIESSINKENNNLDNIVEVKNQVQHESKPIAQKNYKINLKQSINRDNEQTFQLSTAIHDEQIIYRNPIQSLLNNQSSQTNINEAELETNARILQEKLETFKIYIEDLTVTPGPVVTQYEFVPAPGIKISKIESLTDDLAMALKAKGIRIIAPIPGKGTIGVEIPNNNPSMVRFGEVINSNKFINSNAKLPIAFGKTIAGEVYVADLTKMPHLLIAGSTGSGKSVGVNTLITSLLYKMHPSELKFVIIDPKKVELRQYEGLAFHYMATSPDIEDIIVTKPEDAVIVLKAAVKEMELRYEILASAAQRNISDYNEKVLKGTLKVKDDEVHRPMPYIVVIVDELADLMLTASKEIEEPITRLAQMARAVGIHLVIATQRPSVDVITGVIKANFPARIAYLVASKIDSRTILDMQGAEQLLGQGDMLFLPPGQPKPVRIQNAFISTDEVETVCEFIEAQKGYSEPYYLPTLLEKSSKGSINPEDRDELFEEAARLIIRTQQGSVSLLQRRLKIGYARAGRIVDELESAGVVGAFDGSKARQVLMESESELEAILW